GGSDGVIRLWDVAGGEALRALSHPGEVRALAFFPDGQTLASAGADGAVRLWAAADGGVRQTLDPLDGLSAPAGAPGRQTGGSAGVSGAICLWHTESPPARPNFVLLSPPGHGVAAVAFSPDGRHLATGTPDGSVYVLRLAARESPSALPDPPH